MMALDLVRRGLSRLLIGLGIVIIAAGYMVHKGEADALLRRVRRGEEP